jgi:hypothetical protein
MQTFVTKLHHDLLPTGCRVHRYQANYEKSCPSCSCEDKDQAHLFQCLDTRREEWRVQFVKSIGTKCRSMRVSPPNITKSLTQGIESFLFDTTFPAYDDDVPPRLRLLAEEQRASIGWHQLIRGYWSTRWEQQQQSYRESNPEDDQENQTHSSHWVSSMQRHIWAEVRKLWIMLRNEDHHGKEELMVKIKRQCDQFRRETEWLYSMKEQCLPGIIFIRIRVSMACVVVTRCFVTMFLGGSYHDRDNPHNNEAPHGKTMVWMTLVCSQNEGRQQSSSRSRGLRTLDDLMMMMMMMRTIFYGGTCTDCTGSNGWTATRRRQRRDDGNNTNTNNNSNNTSRNTNHDRATVKMTPGARSGTVRRGHRSKMKAERHRCSRMTKKTMAKRRKDDEDDTAPTGSEKTRMMNEGGATLLETSDHGHGDDLHQGRMEEDEDGGTPMMSATGTLDRKTGQATPMRQSATGTLDRKTDQATPTTCFQPSTPTHENKRPTRTNDKECRCHDDDAQDGCRMLAMKSIAARRGKLLDDDRQVDSMVLDYQGEAQSTFSSLGPSGCRGSVSTHGCDR